MNNIISREEIIETYYEKVGTMSVSREIKDKIQQMASKIADQIIAQYEIRNLILKEIEDEGSVGGKKMVVALEFERINDELPSSTK